MLAADTRGLGKHSDYVLIVFVLSLSWVGSGSEEERKFYKSIENKITLRLTDAEVL